MADANQAAASSAASPASALQHLADAALPLVAYAPVGFALLDTDLRFVLVNLLRLAHQASASGAYQWRPQRGTVEWTPEYRALYGLEGTVEGSYDRWIAVPGIHLAARHLAGTDAHVAPAQVALVIGDVVGHDIEAAIAMGQIRNAIAGLSFARSDPAEVLCHLDEFVAHQPGLRNTTMGYGRIEVSTGWLCYATAGHPPPLLVRSDGSAEYFEGGRSGPLGQATARCEETVRLRPGDTLVLSTDGLVERRGVSIDDGLERLAAAGVAARAEHVDHVADHLLAELLIDAGQRDDIALLLVRLG
jgi:hypothetical protein